MEYDKEFDRDFMRRTLELVSTYSGPHDATLLLNCLLGLLIVPKESLLDRIPETPLASLAQWGISPDSILQVGTKNTQNSRPDSLRGVVHSLRNALAHFRFRPVHCDGIIEGFTFEDRSGFEARIELVQLRTFVERLADHLARTPVGRAA